MSSKESRTNVTIETELAKESRTNVTIETELAKESRTHETNAQCHAKESRTTLTNETETGSNNGNDGMCTTLHDLANDNANTRDEVDNKSENPAAVPNKYIPTVVQAKNVLALPASVPNYSITTLDSITTLTTPRESPDMILMDHAFGSKTHTMNPMDRTSERQYHDHNAMDRALENEITREHAEIKAMLRHCGRGRNGLILMLRDFSQDTKNAELQIDFDAEQKAALHDLLTLELDEQKNHDLELKTGRNWPAN